LAGNGYPDSMKTCSRSLHAHVTTRRAKSGPIATVRLTGDGALCWYTAQVPDALDLYRVVAAAVRHHAAGEFARVEYQLRLEV